MAEDADLMLETFARHVSPEGFVDAAIETDAHGGACGILHFVHEQRRQLTAWRLGKPRLPQPNAAPMHLMHGKSVMNETSQLCWHVSC